MRTTLFIIAFATAVCVSKTKHLGDESFPTSLARGTNDVQFLRNTVSDGERIEKMFSIIRSLFPLVLFVYGIIDQEQALSVLGSVQRQPRFRAGVEYLMSSDGDSMLSRLLTVCTRAREALEEGTEHDLLPASDTWE